jgi:formylglycine-generating enzyme required for sulfatase activity
MNVRISLLLLAALLLSACASPTSQPASLPEIETGVDASGWVRVPRGEFLYGQHNHATPVDYDYEIMVTDVTNAQFAAYLNQALADGALKQEGERILGYYPGDEFHAYEHEVEIKAGETLHVPLDDPGQRLVSSDGSFSAQPAYANHPVTLVTWFGAQAYCQYYGWRLPSEVEWEKAARGSDGRAFPWGDEIQRNNANYYSSYDLFEKLAGKGGSTSPVGFYNGNTYDGYTTLDSPSPYGLYDMAGNVWQWTGDVYEKQHYRYLRGGSKDTYAYNLRAWTRNSAGPEYYSPAVGFRCAREVNP